MVAGQTHQNTLAQMIESHTDLTNLTEAASQKARSYHPACTLGAADSKGEATCHFVRFVRSA